MSGDVWQVERYNLRKRTWEPFGRPSTDFAAQYKKVSALQACGSKARLAKVTAKPAAAVETPEDFAPVPENPEEANDTVHRALAYLAGAKKSMEE